MHSSFAQVNFSFLQSARRINCFQAFPCSFLTRKCLLWYFSGTLRCSRRNRRCSLRFRCIRHRRPRRLRKRSEMKNLGSWNETSKLQFSRVAMRNYYFAIIFLHSVDSSELSAQSCVPSQTKYDCMHSPFWHLNSKLKCIFFSDWGAFRDVSFTSCRELVVWFLSLHSVNSVRVNYNNLKNNIFINGD